MRDPTQLVDMKGKNVESGAGDGRLWDGPVRKRTGEIDDWMIDDWMIDDCSIDDSIEPIRDLSIVNLKIVNLCRVSSC
jgi:hypothetical protein